MRGKSAGTRPLTNPLGVVFPRTGGSSARAFFRDSVLLGVELALRRGGNTTGSDKIPRVNGGERSSSDDEENIALDLVIVWNAHATFEPTAAQAAAGEAVLMHVLTPSRAGVWTSEGDESW